MSINVEAPRGDVALNFRAPYREVMPPHAIVFTNGVLHNENAMSNRAGDLAERPHDQVVFVVNHALRKQTEASSERHNSLIPSYAVQDAQPLRAGLEALKQNVQEAEKTPNAQEIRERYQQADQQPSTSLEDRIARRMGNTKWLWISDSDGTLTIDPHNYLERLIPASRPGEQILREHGRESFPEAFAATWRHGLDVIPQSYRTAGQNVPLRQGVNETIHFAKDRGDRFMVLSANFNHFVYGVLDQIPEAADIEVHAVTHDDLTATEKGDVIKKEAIQNHDMATIYIGDGSSDLPSIEAQEYIACYFALEGSTFAEELQDKGLPYFTYQTFDDIRVQMEAINQKTTALPPAA